MELVSAEGMNETQDIGVEEVEFSGSDLIEFLQGKLEEISLQLEELQTKHEKSLFRLEISGVIIIKSTCTLFFTSIELFWSLMRKLCVSGEVVNRRTVMPKKRLGEATNFPC